MSDNLNYPNIWGRSILTSAEEILGERGVNALLNLIGLQQYIGNYPPDNIKKEFPFEHVSKIQQGLWEMYGAKGARVFATKGGVSTFNHSLDKFDKVQKAAQLAMSVGSHPSTHESRFAFLCQILQHCQRPSGSHRRR